MSRQRKIVSVFELAKYQIGDIAWAVMLQSPSSMPIIEDKDTWMLNQHLKTLYSRGPYKQLWNENVELPKLSHSDFKNIMALLTMKISVVQFPIVDILRDNDTGEFLYISDNDQLMVESTLLHSKALARKERARILNLLQGWFKTNK